MLARAAVSLALALGGAACSCHASHADAGNHSAASTTTRAAARRVVLASSRQARVRVIVPARVFDVEPVPPKPPKLPKGAPRPIGPKPPKRPHLTAPQLRAQGEARKLQAAARDLAHYLSLLSGSDVVAVREPATLEPGIIPIWLAEDARQRFGPLGRHADGDQAFRVVVRSDGLGLYGESDLATGYAIYELLDRLGCRWFMPGELGEDVPQRDSLGLAESDEILVPSTLYRGVWYADDDFKRRNRLDGVKISAGHMLEKWITSAEREEHPEWRAQIAGAAQPSRLRWSSPGLADAMADNIRKNVAKKPVDSVSMSPLDGVNFDDTFDTAIDARDWDPTVNGVSLTDRLLFLVNQVAKNLETDQPQLKLGLLAYVSYSRPPVREKLHRNIVPVIAPITYCRPHPWSDDACPGAKDLRDNVIGWSDRAEQLAFRGYAFNLAEPAAPNPMLGAWSYDLPFLFEHKVRYFQPETLPSFETSLPALWLGIRLSWNRRQEPGQVLQELFERFYGHASAKARTYVDLIDRAWTDTPEYSGAGLGYERRFTPALLAAARYAMDQTKAACATDVERARVAMLDESLAQLERYMAMERALSEGGLVGLAAQYEAWQAKAGALAEQYAPNSAFGKTGWGGPTGVYGYYMKRFLEAIYREADRIGREQRVLTPRPLCQLKYRLAPLLQPPIADAAAVLGDGDPSMDVCRETWSSIGQHDYFGAMWYQVDFDPGALAVDKPSFVWLSRVDGATQVWLNGQPLRPKDAAPDAAKSVETHLKPLAFDTNGALRPHADNRLTVLVRRTRLAELGAGGLVGPVIVYADR